MMTVAGYETNRASLTAPKAVWRVYWSPEGRCIAVVVARSARSACRMAPYPYRRYLGELYAEKG